MSFPEHLKTIMAAAAFAGLGALGIYSGLDPSSGLPQEASLLRAEGAAIEYREYKYGVRFKLAGHPHGFDYLSKGNAADQVANAIGSSAGQTVRVLYDPKSLGGPVYSKEEYFTVFSLTVADRSIRSYGQVAAAWRSDNRIGYWGGWAAVAIGIGLALYAWRSRGAA